MKKMPRDISIKKVMVIGSGPIVIGQAAEFDYAGTQACKSLKEEGMEVVLVNSNPATIMTDDHMADRVYIEPLTLAALTWIIDKERPDGLLATLGGQTGLNMAVELSEAGVLERYDVRLLGTPLSAIDQAEDRESFRQLMLDIGEPIPRSEIVTTTEEGLAAAKNIGFPIIVRPAFTMGGLGGGIADDMAGLKEILHTGLMHSRIHQVLLEQSVAGWKEVEYEVMRDGNDTAIIICNMENFDPVGVHTGDSIVVAPSQTLTDQEYHRLRSASLKIIKALKIEGGCNVQLALDPKSERYIVIEVNPRVSRSSALASKAAGYPIAKIAAKIAVGLHLHEIPNAVTKTTMAAYEPALDYVVTKIPKWPFDKFDYANRTLGTQMKATGEVMAIDRTFESALLKAIISLEGKETGLRKEHLMAADKATIITLLHQVDDQRIFVIAEALRKSVGVERIHDITGVDVWFLEKIHNIIKMERQLSDSYIDGPLLHKAEQMGFTDVEIQALSGKDYAIIDAIRRAHGMYPVYKMVDTCAAEFASSTPYYYATFEEEDENVITKKEAIVVIGSGPIRIGQGIEFDYCSVHAVWAIQSLGYEAIIINNNPETVSTDFDISDKLFFEPLFIEDVMNVIQEEKPKGVIVQYGGQTAINLAPKLLERGVQILGTSVDAIDCAEDRRRFDRLLKELNIPRPKGVAVRDLAEARQKAATIGYPVLVRPSYVIGGRAMMVVDNEDELVAYMKEAMALSGEQPILIDAYIEGIEVEVDAISDGKDILVPGIMEHLERTGVHSGDSFCVYPPRNLSAQVVTTIMAHTAMLARALRVVGLMNIQFVVRDEQVYVIEVNPRASRTVPILSKVTKVPMVTLAMQVSLGEKLKDLPYGTGLYKTTGLVAVKAPVFSFVKLDGVDAALTPEMKSTGEVLGVDATYDRALLKAFLGAGYTFGLTGKVLFSISDKAKAESVAYARAFLNRGFDLVATEGTAAFLRRQGLSCGVMAIEGTKALQDGMKAGEISLLVNMPTKGKDVSRDGYRLRNMAQHLDVPSFSCFDTVKAWLTAYDAHQGVADLTYDVLDGYMG